ncbi:Tetraspanin-9 [Bagarius yarrelli]|uniref:Tetraspanin-9 n=1 Tax=Bagarius yarrelli TaxID=175774 RepID=A0A556UZN9_BAGYA|nr:Tetraspanin-9 [Bagarius yarrelli]
MLEAIRRTASRASRSVRASTPAKDPVSQLEDLSITCTNEICDKILALYRSEELNRPEGEKTALKSNQESQGRMKSLEEVVSIHRCSSWYTVSSASDSVSTTTEAMAPDCTPSAPQAEKPFSNQFISKASHVVSEVLQKTEQKIAASASPHTSASTSACTETEMNFLMEMAKSTAKEILQNLFVLLVQSLREHLSGVSCSDADQPGAGQEQEFLSDTPNACKQKPVVSEESESLVNVCPETAELDSSLKNIQEFAAAELLLEEATQVASNILVERLSSDISIGLDSSGSGTALLSASSVDLDRLVSEILNQVIREVAQELEVNDVVNGSEARLDEAQVSDADDRAASHSRRSSDVSSNLQSPSELEDKESVNEFIDPEIKPQAPVQKGPLVPLHLFNVVRNHLKGIFSSFSKTDTKTIDAPGVEEEEVRPEVNGDDSKQELVEAEISHLPLSFPSLSVANLLLVAGGVTMVTGFLGCLGALKEQRCLLMTFFVILLLLFLTEAALVLMLGLFHRELDQKAKEDLIERMRDYDSNLGLKKSWDNMQRIFKCCGVSNHTDWYNRTTEGPPPQSCCRDHTPPCHRWEEPCYEKAKAWVLDNITWVLGFGVCLGIVQVKQHL